MGSIHPNIVQTINKMKLNLNQNLRNTSKFERKNYEKYSRKSLAGQIAEELNKILH